MLEVFALVAFALILSVLVIVYIGVFDYDLGSRWHPAWRERVLGAATVPGMYLVFMPAFLLMALYNGDIKEEWEDWCGMMRDHLHLLRTGRNRDAVGAE